MTPSFYADVEYSYLVLKKHCDISLLSRMACIKLPVGSPKATCYTPQPKNEANRCLLFTRPKATIHNDTYLISLQAGHEFIEKFILQAKQEASKPKAFKPAKTESCNASHEASQKLNIPRLGAT